MICLFWQESLLASACTQSIKGWAPLAWQGRRTPHFEMPALLYREVQIPQTRPSPANCLFSSHFSVASEQSSQFPSLQAGSPQCQPGTLLNALGKASGCGLGQRHGAAALPCLWYVWSGLCTRAPLRVSASPRLCPPANPLLGTVHNSRGMRIPGLPA